ncbi:MAG: YbhB/YbcL family Raf kinase inhibitor-like protein [Candidatus Omnitrophota bacterium]|nr:MAG: YbhB/YbcL family Raf kinase inhibitor-like protein [Candidatus Omnitrophota bacterium]
MFLLFVFSLNAWCLEIKSVAFDDGKYIPVKYTCDAANMSPPLHWDDVPAATKSFALVCDDPDAPYAIWVHWVIFNIPPEKREFREDIPQKAILSDRTIQGLNDFGKIGYGGPCPPPNKPHRYFFRLYALDTTFLLDEKTTKRELMQAIEGHILAEAKMVGLYRR